MKKIKREAIEHYDRMITFMEIVLEYDLYNRQDELEDDSEEIESFLRKYMGENYFGEFCSYCQKYKYRCSKCELGTPSKIMSKDELEYFIERGTEIDIYHCCGTHWGEMSDVYTDIPEWIERAKKVRQYIIDNG